MSAKQASPHRFYAADIIRDNGITLRCFRKWRAAGRFPPADGNLNGRLFWLAATYQRWQADVAAGRYAQERRPGGTPARAA
jgi:hypothetical protein